MLTLVGAGGGTGARPCDSDAVLRYYAVYYCVSTALRQVPGSNTLEVCLANASESCEIEIRVIET